MKKIFQETNRTGNLSVAQPYLIEFKSLGEVTQDFSSLIKQMPSSHSLRNTRFFPTSLESRMQFPSFHSYLSTLPDIVFSTRSDILLHTLILYFIQLHIHYFFNIISTFSHLNTQILIILIK